MKKISVVRCLFIIFISLQLFVTLTVSVENKVERNLGDHGKAKSFNFNFRYII